MFQRTQLYTVGTVSITSAFVTTILNALFSTSLHNSIFEARSAGLAAASLSAISCVSLVILILTFGEGVETSAEVWKIWKVRARTLIGTYLFISAGLVTGAMTWSGAQSQVMVLKDPNYRQAEALFVSGSTMGAISIFCQGLICGFSLLSLTKRDNHDIYPPLPPFIWQENSETTIPERQGSNRRTAFDFARVIPALPRLKRCLRPVPSHRYLEHGSLGLPYSSMIPSGHLSEIKNGLTVAIQQKGSADQQQGVDTSPLLPINPNQSSPPRPSSAPQIRSYENNIHPLFRSNSPHLPLTPPPTPFPGTNITAAPFAGQIISLETLRQMRSRQSVSGDRRPSTTGTLPIITETSSDVERQRVSSGTTEEIAVPMPDFILSADIRNSLLRYEKKRSDTL
jgi:hypothetical protein